MARPSAKFFEGQTAPDLPMFSQDNIDWYAEMKRRCMEGFSFRGDRMTGDQWWFYNMCPMPIVKLDKWGNPTDDFGMGFPYWSQEDDYLFKQIEEAEQDKLGVFLFTGRGFGKTQIVLSIGGKIYYFKKSDERLKHLLISASGDAHANATMKKFSQLISVVNKAHPSIAIPLLKDNEDEIIAGEDIEENGKWRTEKYAYMEKIVYGSLAGKTKGRRVDFQLYEESGDWTGAAPLKECIAASRGTYWVGTSKVCREFIIGTGGTVFSSQAKEICYNPDAYGLYKVKNWSQRGTGIVIPAYKKYGGFWEKTGISDYEGAKAAITKMLENAKLDPDPTLYNKLRQEYPETIEQMFEKKGGNRFHLDAIAKNIALMEEDPSLRQGMWVNLHWKKKDGKIVGVEWEERPDGRVWMLEPPKINEATQDVEPRLYVGGYDGIDLGTEDTAKSSGQGSKGSISIKKRMLPGAGTNNIYVCHYFDRPEDVEVFYETCYMIMVLYDALTNIEFSKVGFVGYLKKAPHSWRKKAYDYLMKRPRITLTDADADENKTKLVGTTATDKNFQYGETFLAKYTKDYGHQILCLPVCKDLTDFSMDERGKHDITVSMMMTEIGDEELMDQPVGVQKPPYSTEEEFGYYTDAKGVKKWGKIPKKNTDQFGLKDQNYTVYLEKGKLHILNVN